MSDRRLVALLERWRVAAPRPVGIDELTRRLGSAFRAYEIPLYTMARSDYANDEEVREELIVCLYTITHRDVLNRIDDDEAREQQQISADDEEQLYWRDLFEEHPDDDGGLGYRLLLTQHALGQRTSIVLEREGDYVTSFKVYGHSGPLIDRLTAWVGRPEREDGEQPDYPTMSRGDLDDPDFVRYLEALERADLI